MGDSTPAAPPLPGNGDDGVSRRPRLPRIARPPAGLGRSHQGTIRPGHFDYAGPLTEAILLGSVATRFPKKTLEWDAAAMKVTNLPEANEFVQHNYRSGWSL